MKRKRVSMQTFDINVYRKFIEACEKINSEFGSFGPNYEKLLTVMPKGLSGAEVPKDIFEKLKQNEDQKVEFLQGRIEKFIDPSLYTFQLN